MTYLQYLRTQNFRNIHSIEIEPCPKLNLFFGENGVGKTNLLESIYLCGHLKPLRSVKKLSDLIQQTESETFIHTRIEGIESFEIKIHVNGDKKSVRLNEQDIRSHKDLFQQLLVVSFVPEDLQIIFGSASQRRRLMDQLAHFLFPNYANILRRFEKTLFSRNNLLKGYPLDLEQLDSFSEIFCQLSGEIIERRKEALAIWEPHFHQLLNLIAPNLNGISLRYESSADMTLSMKDALRATRKSELERRITLIGPHLDDLEISLHGLPARHTFSRGQARAFTLCAKMAQLQSIYEQREISPVLLLDDVIGELDPFHAQSLMACVQTLDTQTFITTTHLSHLPQALDSARKFEISNGAIISTR